MNTIKDSSTLPSGHPFTRSISEYIYKKRVDLQSVLRDALDMKYGNWDYRHDARYLSKKDFQIAFKEIIGNLDTNSKILITGANDGYEVELVPPHSNIIALDLSKTALDRLKKKYPVVTTKWDDLQELPYEDDTFSVYISMRTITSSNVNLKTAVEESLRVTKNGGIIVYSIPNAYLVENRLVQGMYITKSKTIDSQLPYKYLENIKKLIQPVAADLSVVSIPSEIIIRFSINK